MVAEEVEALLTIPVSLLKRLPTLRNFLQAGIPRPVVDDLLQVLPVMIQ